MDIVTFGNITKAGDLGDSPETKEYNLKETEEGYHFLNVKDKKKMRKKELQDFVKQVVACKKLLNKLTGVDALLDMLSNKLIQITFVFFGFFYLVVKDFGEMNYILITVLNIFIIWYAVSGLLIKNILQIQNDFHMGWNFSVAITGKGITQVLLLTLLMFMFDISRKSISIHPWDTIMYLIIYVIQWAGIIIFVIMMFHYIQEIIFFIEGIYSEIND